MHQARPCFGQVQSGSCKVCLFRLLMKTADAEAEHAEEPKQASPVPAATSPASKVSFCTAGSSCNPRLHGASPGLCHKLPQTDVCLLS